MNTPTYGLELEKTFTGLDGSPHAVGRPYFENLQAIKRERGEQTALKYLGTVVVGVSMPYGEEGLDNSFSLGESATGPIAEKDGGLNILARVVNTELADVVTSLSKEAASVLNMSNHPLARINSVVYAQTVVPKPVYGYLRDIRNWNHSAGINGKSQNSPSIGISAEQAVRAVNVVVGLGAGFVALYANSPFEEGKYTGMQESRLNMWADMFGRARFAGDRRLHKPPSRPFENFRDYFKWMFGPDTSMYFVATELGGDHIKSEKGQVRLVRVGGDPSLLEYLKKGQWPGTVFGTGEPVNVRPSMDHFQMHQFTQFAGARIRYGLKKEIFPVEEFSAAMEGSGSEVDDLFARKGAYFYIEGRDVGANFPDEELLRLPNGEQLARSVVISPTAIQAGLIRNIDAAWDLVSKYGWANLLALRDDAIRSGLDARHNGLAVRDVCEEMLSVASKGLMANEQWMLAYPAFVLESGMNGATRALRLLNSFHGSTADKIKQVIGKRIIALP